MKTLHLYFGFEFMLNGKRWSINDDRETKDYTVIEHEDDAEHEGWSNCTGKWLKMTAEQIKKAVTAETGETFGTVEFGWGPFD